MTQTPAPLDFALSLTWDDLPADCQARVRLCLLDLVGIAIGGAATRLSTIIRDHAHAEFGGKHPMLLDTRSASASGVALAAGMTIDALDGHDGYNPAKGHIGFPNLCRPLAPRPPARSGWPRLPHRACRWLRIRRPRGRGTARHRP